LLQVYAKARYKIRYGKYARCYWQSKKERKGTGREAVLKSFSKFVMWH
jgi:hypothetical protein